MLVLLLIALLEAAAAGGGPPTEGRPPAVGGAVQRTGTTQPRARDLGGPFDGTPGPLNAITDVEGVAVGHSTIIRGDGALKVGQGPVRTGVTAVVPRGRATLNEPVF